jgi:hypothetical protein
VELGGVAEALGKRFDLTAQTARKLSIGSSRFMPHSLTAKNGEAKTGGAMKEGKLAIDRYISYRLRDELISLAYILFKEEPEENGRYYLVGTEGVFTGGQKFSEVLAGKANYGWSPAFTDRMYAQPFTELAEAAAAYETLIAKLAPRISE